MPDPRRGSGGRDTQELFFFTLPPDDLELRGKLVKKADEYKGRCAGIEFQEPELDLCKWKVLEVFLARGQWDEAVGREVKEQIITQLAGTGLGGEKPDSNTYWKDEERKKTLGMAIRVVRAYVSGEGRLKGGTGLK